MRIKKLIACDVRKAQIENEIESRKRVMSDKYYKVSIYSRLLNSQSSNNLLNLSSKI